MFIIILLVFFFFSSLYSAVLQILFLQLVLYVHENFHSLIIMILTYILIYYSYIRSSNSISSVMFTNVYKTNIHSLVTVILAYILFHHSFSRFFSKFYSFSHITKLFSYVVSKYSCNNSYIYSHVHSPNYTPSAIFTNVRNCTSIHSHIYIILHSAFHIYSYLSPSSLKHSLTFSPQ